ncbi:FAD-dependent oxidoreductase [Thermoflexibacter ruber]|uniref:Kynurenine 3-monooxygenase n=1 Tax=Thermoflexibacter ruber TaxID=1003 RepID=A0A1I2IIR4_9BACT|nr:NAD(P)/FAD-dependent oxidoreductase [Thermoflexibacter ruber]SFF41560.1 kynurenine 3-monooxygenase [Thermoflexibacter ruber]
MKKVAILGAGLVGSLLSIFLSKRGYQVEVYERRDDPRHKGYVGGRSINLALSDRGWRALEKVGIAEKIKKIAIPMHGRMIHDLQGHLTFQPYGKEGQAIYSVSRALLNIELIDYAEKEEKVKFYFHQRCEDLDLEKKVIYLQDTESQEKSQISADIIFGADGAFSAVRLAMQKTDRFNYAQTYLEYGYKELTIPSLPDGSHALDKNALHIWPRKSFMLIALPNIDGSFTCTLFFPYEGKPSFATLKSSQDVTDFFKATFPDAFSVLPNLVEEFFTNPTSSLVMVKSQPWVYRSGVALIGDAAHAIVPFYGQGMNAGFEDCYVLNEILDKHLDNWEISLQEYQEKRIPDANAIAELALNNFVEMRDLVADEKFLLRKKIEAKMYELYPEKWTPLYSMVTFSPETRYSEALAKGKKQDAIMSEIMQLPHIEHIWEDLVLEEVTRRLS